jgi:hypothetical protein
MVVVDENLAAMNLDYISSALVAGGTFGRSIGASSKLEVT